MAGGFGRSGHLKLGELGKEDHNGEAVDEAQHDGVRHEPDELAEFEDTCGKLEDAHQDNGREEVFNPVLGDERDHDHGESARRARDHAGPPADQCGDETDDKGGIEPDQRIDLGDEGKGHSFGYQRQRDGQAGQKLNLDPVRREFGEVRLRKILRAEAICECSEGGFACHGAGSVCLALYVRRPYGGLYAAVQHKDRRKY